MDDDTEEPAPSRPSQLSKTPSWVMLGFVLGAIAVYTLPRPAKQIVAPPPDVVAKTQPAPAPPVPPPTVERAVFFEDVFAEWSKYAVWENELTEVAFWNAATKSFSDRFEVFRSGEKYYFRSIARFTRPRLTHGVPGNSPLQFTETQAARDEWLRENSAENMKALLGPSAKKAP